MTPTIQCFDDHSVQMPPAEVQCDNIFFHEHLQMSQSDRINSTPDVRKSHQYAPYLRNRNQTCNNKKSTSCSSAALKLNVKKLLKNSPEETEVSEEQLHLFRKRQALLLVTIKTMTLFHQNRILERKLSALYKRVMQIPKESTNSDSSIE